MNAPISSVSEGLSIYAELAFSCSNRTVHGVAPRPTFHLRVAFAPRPAPAEPGFFARWSAAVEMPPGQILREHRLVAQKRLLMGLHGQRKTCGSSGRIRKLERRYRRSRRR
jgi:hypothetical protein